MFFSRVCSRFGQFDSRISSSRFYRKNPARKLKRVEQDELLSKLVTPSIRSTQDVNRLKETILKDSDVFSSEDIDRSLIIHFAKTKQFNGGLSYIKYLEDDTKQKLHIFLTNQQLFMYFRKRYTEGSLSTSEQQKIVELYNNFKAKSEIMDSLSLENIILGLSVTAEWYLCLNLLDDLKKLDRPSSICYSAIVAAAFIYKNDKVAWKLLDELFDKQRTPKDVIFLAYFERMRILSDTNEILSKLDELFEKCNQNNFILTENNALHLCKLFNDLKLTYKDSTMNKIGHCKNCRNKIHLQEISDGVFENLRNKFFEGVLIGKNIFTKSTPEELSKFQDFLKTLKNYDVVIDGLNVAYTAGTKQQPEVYATLIAHVVAHFVSNNKKVVVLGRKHMESWPKKQWGYIKSNTGLFLTHNISMDDPYLIYCALHCGKDTILVSRDLMRSHLFALKDPKDKIIFSRWLEQRQYQITHVRNDGKVFFKYPRAYSRIVQRNNKNWHIPFSETEAETEDNSTADSDRWLCVDRP